MAGEQLEPRREILVPVTGELVHADNPEALGPALAYVTQLLDELRDTKSALEGAIVDYAKRAASDEIELDTGYVIVVSPPRRETTYDAGAIEEGLRDAGMPESRISEIVVETVEHKVKAVELKKAAARNKEYAAVMERHRTVVEKRPSVSVKPPPSPSKSRAKPKKGAES